MEGQLPPTSTRGQVRHGRKLTGDTTTDVDFRELSEEHNALLERSCAGFPRRLVNTFKDVMRDQVANEYVCEFVRNKIRRVVKDPKVAELLCPTDHYFATKRPVLENGYYQTYNRPNVTLVEVKSNPIERIIPRGIRTTAGDYDLDASARAGVGVST